jgi:hypothetical protein
MHVGAGTGVGDVATNESSSGAPEVRFTTCFGYSMRSRMPFSSLREGEGTPLDVTLDEEEPLTPSGSPMLELTQGIFARIFAVDAGYLVWIEDVGWFRVDPARPSIAFSGPPFGPRCESRLLGLPTALCFMHRGDLPMHAAAIDVHGSAVLLAAPGRFGKSTLASAFLQAGCRPLSEDMTCIRLSPEPSVIPGSAMLRIRPDVFERLEFPGTTVVGQEPERTFLSIDGSLRGDSAPVPLRAIVFLRRSDDELTMERVEVASAFPDLWTLSFNLPTDADRTRCFEGITQLAGRVPIWNLHRRLSFEHLPQVVDAVISRCLGS